VNDRGDIHSTAEDDAAMESALLQQVLALHPTTVTLEELTRELGEDPDDIERAVRDLVATGLLHRNESLVLPSRAALRFDELMEG
jgi:DNA-binding IclR family transcriptional regulator